MVRAQVLATTVWGARHGVQTLTQLFTATSMPASSAGATPKVVSLSSGLDVFATFICVWSVRSLIP